MGRLADSGVHSPVSASLFAQSLVSAREDDTGVPGIS